MPGIRTNLINLGKSFHKFKQMEQEKQTIDLTPSWVEAANICLVVLESGTPEGKKQAKQEILKMARIADEYKALVINNKKD